MRAIKVCIVHGVERESCPFGCLAPRTVMHAPSSTSPTDERTFDKAVIANLRASLARIVSTIPDQGPIPAVIDGLWTDGVVAAISDLVLRLDAHEDASTPAFDEIVKLCGLAKTWEYPGQVIRDVEDSIKRRDAKIAQLRFECGQHAMNNVDLRADLDLWKQRATVDWSKGPYAVAPGQEPGEIRVTARNLADENRCIQEERTKDLHVMTRQRKVIEELRTKLRVAEAVRDDARAASQRDLERRRASNPLTDEELHALGWIRKYIAKELFDSTGENKDKLAAAAIDKLLGGAR